MEILKSQLVTKVTMKNDNRCSFEEMSPAAADGGCSKQAATQDLQAKIPVQATIYICRISQISPVQSFLLGVFAE